MAPFVMFIAISMCCCLYATKAQTDPEAAYVYSGEPWNKELNLPTSDDNELCGIWVHLAATWYPSPAPRVKGTIDLKFEHPKLKEASEDVLEIQHDKEKREKSIPICFSPCLTILQQMDQKTFTLDAKTKNIKQENAITLQVISEKMSTLSYIEHCSERNTLVKKFLAIVSVQVVFLFLGLCLCVLFIWNRYNTKTGGRDSRSDLPGPGGPEQPLSANPPTTKGGPRSGRQGKKDE